MFQFFGPILPQCTGDILVSGRAERICTLCDLLALIDNLVKFAVVLAPILVTVFIIVGAFYIITAAGNTSRLAQGKKIITSAVVGLIIVLGAWIIVSTAFLLLTGSYHGPLPIPWYRIQC